MLILLSLACGDPAPADTSAVVDASIESFLLDYGTLLCERLEVCDEHFSAHFEDAADCEATLAEDLAQYEICELDDQAGVACLEELAAAGCEAVLRNDLPACEGVWDCP